MGDCYGESQLQGGRDGVGLRFVICRRACLGLLAHIILDKELTTCNKPISKFSYRVPCQSVIDLRRCPIMNGRANNIARWHVTIPTEMVRGNETEANGLKIVRFKVAGQDSITKHDEMLWFQFIISGHVHDVL